MKLLLKTLDRIHTAEMTIDFVEKLAQVAGTWVTVETEYLFSDQYNIIENNLRIRDAWVCEIVDDARIGLRKCRYCGNHVHTSVDYCAKHPECKDYPLKDLLSERDKKIQQEKLETEKEIASAKGATKKWLKKLQGDTLTKSDISALKRIWERQDSVFWDTETNKVSEKALAERQAVCNMLINRIDVIGGFKITDEQTRQGIDYLKNRQFTPTGAKRKNAPLEDHQMEILNRLTEFRFMGFYDAHQNPYTQTYTSTPIYKVIGVRDNGLRDTFSYHCGSWQSSSNEIVIL